MSDLFDATIDAKVDEIEERGLVAEERVTALGFSIVYGREYEGEIVERWCVYDVGDASGFSVEEVAMIEGDRPTQSVHDPLHEFGDWSRPMSDDEWAMLIVSGS